MCTTAFLLEQSYLVVVKVVPFCIGLDSCFTSRRWCNFKSVFY